MNLRLFSTSILAAGLLAMVPVAGLRAQARVPVLPVEIRHVFDPPGSSGFARYITVATDGSAVLMTWPQDFPSGPQIWRATATGETRLLRAFSANDSAARAALSPAPGGGFYGILERAAATGRGILYRITVDGTFDVLHTFGDGGRFDFPEQIRLGSDGTTYVSSYPFTQDSNISVLVIRPDGTVVPNAFTAPGMLFAVDANGVGYGMASRCQPVCALDLFRRQPDGTVVWLQSLVAGVFYPDAADLARSPAGVLVGVAPLSLTNDCQVFRFDGSFQQIAQIAASQASAPCVGRVRWDPVTGSFVGVAGAQVFRVSATGVFSTVRRFDPQEGVPADVTGMPSGETWAAVHGAGVFSTPCHSASAVVSVTGGTPLSVVASLEASSNAEGAGLFGPFTIDPDGTVYGVARDGGTYNAGTIYSVTPGGAFKRLYAFSCGGDGGHPNSLVRTSSGALFGATTVGAGHSGTIFEVGRSGNLRTHFVFRRAEDGGNPGPLAAGRDGAIYGWTTTGGLFGRGTAFRVSATGVFSKLHDFGPADGLVGVPRGAAVQGSDGQLYGVAFEGYLCSAFPCRSALFRMTLAGALTVLQTGGQGTSYDLLIDGPLFNGPDNRIYGSYSNGETFAVTVEGQITRYAGYVRAQTAAPDGGLYHLEYADGYRQTTTGLIDRFSMSGLPTSVTYTVEAGSNQLCATGIVSGNQAGLLYCLRLLGPKPPGGVRVVR